MSREGLLIAVDKTIFKKSETCFGYLRSRTLRLNPFVNARKYVWVDTHRTLLIEVRIFVSSAMFPQLFREKITYENHSLADIGL